MAQAVIKALPCYRRDLAIRVDTVAPSTSLAGSLRRYSSSIDEPCQQPASIQKSIDEPCRQPASIQWLYRRALPAAYVDVVALSREDPGDCVGTATLWIGASWAT